LLGFSFSVKIKTGFYEINICDLKFWNAILSSRQRWDSGHNHKQLVAGRNCIPSLSRPAETAVADARA
jgi:hypothetical protein